MPAMPGRKEGRVGADSEGKASEWLEPTGGLGWFAWLGVCVSGLTQATGSRKCRAPSHKACTSGVGRGPRGESRGGGRDGEKEEGKERNEQEVIDPLQGAGDARAGKLR